MGNHEEIKKSGLGTAGLVLGIIGVCTSIIPIINNLSFIMGILAIIFGIIALVKKDSKGKTITVIVLGVIAIFITINAQKAVSETISSTMNNFNDTMGQMTGDKTDEILANNADVVIGDFSVTKSKYSTDTNLTVDVKNKSSETKSFSIQIEAVDSNGSRIDSGYVYANNLTAGQSQSFNMFTYVSSDKLEKMKNATFKIVEVSMY